MKELVEDLKITNDNLYCANKMLEKENKRLNIIINSINDYLVRNITNNSLDFMYRLGFKETYNYLEKLRGDKK